MDDVTSLLAKYRVDAGYVPMEHAKVTVGVTGPKTGLFPYVTVAFYGRTPRTASGGFRRIHASISSSPALPGAGEEERSIAALTACTPDPRNEKGLHAAPGRL